MKNIAYLILLTTGLACGATDTTELQQEGQHPDIPVPGQEGRIDGSVWEDGLFNSPAAKVEFCSEYGWLEEAWFCSDLGQVGQAFTAEVFHGMLVGTDGACYGPQTTTSRDCMFPSKKQYRVRIDTSGCFNGEAPPNGPSTLQEQNILDGLRAGIKLWHGKGGLTVVNEGSIGSANYLPIVVTCGQTESTTALAEGGLGGSFSNRGSMPASAGKDPRNALIVSSTSFVVNMKNTFNHIKNRCGLADSTLVFNTARYVGVHEAGHVLAFDHFGSTNAGNIMNPFSNSCAPSSAINSVFSTAIGNFNPGSGTPTVVSTSGLGGYSPL